jgi:hypothetical protein
MDNLRSVAVLLAELLLEHHGAGQKSCTAVIGVALMPAHLVPAQIQSGPIIGVSPGHFKLICEELCILDF